MQLDPRSSLVKGVAITPVYADEGQPSDLLQFQAISGAGEAPQMW